MGSIVGLVFDVLLFWTSKIYSWWTQKKPVDTLLEQLAEARTFEEWEDVAYLLDAELGNDLWRQNPTSKHYDYRLIHERLQSLIEAREEGDIAGLINTLRSGLVRNLGNISSPRLYNRAYAGSKLLIEDYITSVALAIERVTSLPTSPLHESVLTSQAKLDLLHDARQAFGRSTLVLQGGAVFGLCHLGVVKALHLRGLLPRIVTGTATGALIAALVGIHTEDELLRFLNGEGIDLTAFAIRGRVGVLGDEKIDNDYRNQSGWYNTLTRRLRRFLREGYFLDVKVLEDCVRANVGDLTFEEAYHKTKRVLNITVTTTGRGGVPNLLNYLTAPNVVSSPVPPLLTPTVYANSQLQLIWSAALASNVSSSRLYSPVTLQCKDETGNIVPWASAQEVTFRSWTHASYDDRGSPLARIAELFNVNHFIVSQARPYIAPFLRSDPHRFYARQNASFKFTTPLLKLLTMEIHHRLNQLDSLGFLPMSIRRFLIDENIPGASLTFVPELTPRDFFRLLENPTRESLEYWILRGERSVWPAEAALKVRCAVEVELDRGYQVVRTRKPLDFTGGLGRYQNGEITGRARAASVGAS